MELYREMQENVAAQDQADAKTAEIFAFFDEVRSLFVALYNAQAPCFPSPREPFCADVAGCGGFVVIGFSMLIYIAIHRSTRNGRSFLWRMYRRGRC